MDPGDPQRQALQGPPRSHHRPSPHHRNRNLLNTTMAHHAPTGGPELTSEGGPRLVAKRNRRPHHLVQMRTDLDRVDLNYCAKRLAPLSVSTPASIVGSITSPSEDSRLLLVPTAKQKLNSNVRRISYVVD
jgi:hypothetical protein